MEEKIDSDGVYKYFIRDKYGKLTINQYGIYASTGYGKSLAEEGLVEAHYDEGFTCIYLGDGMKNKEEGAFAMFEPEARYHLDMLKVIGKDPRSVPVKLYHPFTFNLPKRKKIPNYNIFTIPIKSLNRNEFSMLAETESSSATIRILLQSKQNLSERAGLYEWLWDVYKLVKKGNPDISSASKNFYIPVKSGTSKDMTSITTLFNPFMDDYFLVRNNFDMNLDFKEILQDNKSIHYFSTKYLKDPKMKEFLILLVLNKIIENEEYANKPVLIIIPEVRKYCPEGAVGYQRYLSKAIKEALSTMRNIGGKGYASVLSSQVFKGTDGEIRNSHSQLIIGKLSPDDINRLGQIYSFKEDQRRFLSNPNRSWLVIGSDLIEQHFCFPSWCHKEQDTTFERKFREYYPNLMMTCQDLKREMREEHKAEQDRFKQVFERIRESQKNRGKKNIESEEKIKEGFKKKVEERNEKCKIAYNLYQDGLTLREIGEKMGKSTDTARRWIDKYKKLKKEKSIEFPI